jgi:phage tail-like protein
MKRTEIKTLLPEVFQRTCRRDQTTGQTGGLLDALLAVMEALHAPAEAVLAELGSAFDPRRTRETFVPFLARWVDLERIFAPNDPLARQGRSRPAGSIALGRLRELTASAAWLSKWRGTLPGLQRFLQIATGEHAFIIRENLDAQGQTCLFHFTVQAPATLAPHRPLLERIIESEKPAYCTYDLVL